MLQIVPCTIKEANAFIKQHHRHNGPVVACRIALAVADKQGTIHGVALAGRPIARMLNDGTTLEAVRVCTDGYKHACSMLYAAVWRSAQAIGYTSMITYSLTTESGASLRACGWQCEATITGRSWDCKSRPRNNSRATDMLDKYRWRIRKSKRGA